MNSYATLQMQALPLRGHLHAGFSLFSMIRAFLVPWAILEPPSCVYRFLLLRHSLESRTGAIISGLTALQAVLHRPNDNKCGANRILLPFSFSQGTFFACFWYLTFVHLCRAIDSTLQNS